MSCDHVVKLTCGYESTVQVDMEKGYFFNETYFRHLSFLCVFLHWHTFYGGQMVTFLVMSKKINQLLFMDKRKLYALRYRFIDSDVSYVQWRYWDGIWRHPKYQERKIVEFKEIQLPDGEVMKSLKEKERENYKYLGILQANEVKHTKIIYKLNRIFQTCKEIF